MKTTYTIILTMLSTTLVLMGGLFAIGTYTIVPVTYNEIDQYDKNIAYRKHLSLTKNSPFTKEKEYFIRQAHGPLLPVQVGTFDDPPETGATLGRVQLSGGSTTLMLGYLNTVLAAPIGTTTKQKTPEIMTSTIGHELGHVVLLQPHITARCPALLDPEFQEEIMYNWTHLYEQILSMGEDNWIHVTK